MTEQASEGRKPFAAFLQEQRRGGLHAELTDKLAELVQVCAELGKGGSLTLKISLKPNADGSTMTVSDDVSVKAPEPERGAAIFFADDAGNLSRHDPRQLEIPVREVPLMGMPVQEGGAQ